MSSSVTTGRVPPARTCSSTSTNTSVGYVHVPNTRINGQTDLDLHSRRQFTKDGLIIAEHNDDADEDAW